MSRLHVVVHDSIDDELRPSGGNTYDRALAAAMADRGWSVEVHPVAGSPELAGVLGRIPDGSQVLVDGLVVEPGALRAATGRLRVSLLLHMPPPPDHLALLPRTAATIVTSTWTRDRVREHAGLAHAPVRVATPGVRPAPLARGTTTGGSFLCVGAVLPDKGHEELVEALALVADLDWRCVCVGSLTRDPAFVRRLGAQVARHGLHDRVVLTGTRTSHGLDGTFAGTDVLLHPSRAESYGMVVTEALSYGVPVVAFGVGGVPEAMGRLADGRVPGVLVPPGDVPAYAAALRTWLTDADCRETLRESARERRSTLTGWSETADCVARALAGVPA